MRAFIPIGLASLAALSLAACQPQPPAQGDKGALKVTPGPAPEQPAAAAPPATAPVQNGVDQSPLLPTPPDATPVAPEAPTAPTPAAPTTPPGPPAPPPAPKPVASSFDGAFDLVGTEPFWNLKIRPGGLTLTRPEHADLTAANPGFTELGRSALWTATAGQSRLTVTVTKANCSDGMSERTYPYAAKVTLWGATLSGCAAKVRA